VKKLRNAFLFLAFAYAPYAISANCNTFQEIDKALTDRGCQYLGPTTNAKNTVYTWVCSHPRGDEYRDYVKKNGQFCYIGSEII
jgi:hypothetical protein